MEDVRADTRANREREWRENAELLARVFDSDKPDVVFVPHADDYHTTHIGTHYLALDALRIHLERSRRAEIPVVETEFWHPMRAPNLMVGLSSEVLARLLTATAEHGGEVARNPYHLTLPARFWINYEQEDNCVHLQGDVVAGDDVLRFYL